ncbi:PREDICTED: uncharacterized protein LOC109237793 [Nicotiana attenuata]|uniref:uncharacterized protein LOC109237793 n=1 Tax=Nicotiana attenuata TaxID=49451 RepID=UPI000904AB44|nr:PREDICTED: uncharacterized protein LOC109237793 [Nicotiana attenuata]
MAPFEALYSRRCRSLKGWFAIGEAELIGPDMMHQAIEKVRVIKERLKTAQSRQKSYSDIRHRDLEFKEDDWIFLKVSTVKCIMRLGKKVVGDPELIVSVETIEVNKELTFEEIPVAILDRQLEIKRLPP